ncbi:MAG: porin [Sideroxydans sp.]|nr:porin [Sideroxydans sp.]
MKKTIVALAVAAAFTTPAFADNANVTVYGKALMTIDAKGSNATVAAGAPGVATQVRVNTNASRFGVKGKEDLGEGLSAVYQFELEMDADGSSTTSGLAKSRNSGAGIEGAFGKVMLGIWDTPFKVAHNKIELFDNATSWTSTAVIGRSAGKNYNTRQTNMVQYWSPKLMDSFQVAAMFSPDEAATAANGTLKATNKSIYSLSATYAVADIYVAAAYEGRNDVGAVTTANSTQGTTDKAFRLVGNYDIADFSIGAMAESFTTNTSAIASVKANNVEVVGQYKMGPNHFAVSYAKAGSTATGTNAANDVNQLSLKYAFNFSKRTELFAAYTSNKTNAGTIALPTSVTLTYLGGGIVHAF